MYFFSVKDQSELVCKFEKIIILPPDVIFDDNNSMIYNCALLQQDKINYCFTFK